MVGILMRLFGLFWTYSIAETQFLAFKRLKNDLEGTLLDQF